MRSSFTELQTRASDKISHHARHQDLVCARFRHDARRRVNSNATDIITSDLDFSSMQTGAQRKTNLPTGQTKRQRTTDSSPRTIEGRENSVASSLDQVSPMPRD
jgi:hypothetical protein